MPLDVTGAGDVGVDLNFDVNDFTGIAQDPSFDWVNDFVGTGDFTAEDYASLSEPQQFQIQSTWDQTVEQTLENINNDPQLAGWLDRIEVVQKTPAEILAEQRAGERDRSEYKVIDRETGQPPPTGVMDALKAAFGAVNGVLNSPLGRILAAAGIGAGALALGKLFAGDTPQFNPPAQTPINPIYQEGQNALWHAYTEAGPNGELGSVNLANTFKNALSGAAGMSSYWDKQAGTLNQAQDELAPKQREIRNQAIDTVPGLMQPGPEIGRAEQLNQQMADRLGTYLGAAPTTLADPIQMQLDAEINRVFGGQYSNSQLERQVADESRHLAARLYAQLGPGWETSTPGMEAMATFAQRANELRETDKRNTLAAWLPTEQTRRAYNIDQPQQDQRAWIGALSSPQQTGSNFLAGQRQQTLATNVGMTGFGLQPPNAIQAGSTGMLNPTGLTGLAEDTASRKAADEAAYKAALANYGTAVQDNRQTSSSIGNLGGLIAGNIFRTPTTPTTPPDMNTVTPSAVSP